MLCAVFAFSGAGCAKKESEAPRVWLIDPESVAAESEIRNMFDEYDSDISVSFVPACELDTRIDTALKLGKGPDVFMIYGDTLPDLAEEEAIADLGARLSLGKVKMDEKLDGAVRASLYQGKTWGVPIFADVYMLAFDRSVISVAPETVEKLIEVCADLEKKGMKSFEKMVPQKKSLLFEAMLKENGGAMLNKAKTKLTYSSEAGETALSDCVKIFKNESEEKDTLGDGETAFSIYTTSERKVQAEKHPDSEISLAPLFNLERMQTVLLSMNSKSKNQTRLFAVIEFLESNADKLAGLYKTYSAGKNLKSNSHYDNEAVLILSGARPMPDLCGYDALEKTYLPEAIDKASKGVNTIDSLNESIEGAAGEIWKGKRE